MSFAVITGGSRGIGAAAVRAFVNAGWQVAFFYEKNKDAAEQIAAETGAAAIRCDVADADDVRNAFAKLPPVQLLVNNAGVCCSGLIQDVREEQWDRTFDVNVKGVYHCVREALPGMLREQSGCILNVVSMWGETGAAFESCYSATKGAVIALTKALAKELGPSGIRVNAVSPGVIDTDMNRCYSEADMQALKDETPLGRIGTPEQVADALLWLSEADFVTGQILPVNGGFLI